jgi:hypothetical protein
MIVEAIITRTSPRTTVISKPRFQEAKGLLERYPSATRVLCARRGPPGTVPMLDKEIVLMYGGFKSTKVRLGLDVGASLSQLYGTQKAAARVELRRLGLLGMLAMQMAQGDQDDAEATLRVARDAVEVAGLDRLDHQHIVEIVQQAIRGFETEIS